ncbi:hypothetical protein ABK040_012954 [Willaertia magna]
MEVDEESTTTKDNLNDSFREPLILTEGSDEEDETQLGFQTNVRNPKLEVLGKTYEHYASRKTINVNHVHHFSNNTIASLSQQICKYVNSIPTVIEIEDESDKENSTQHNSQVSPSKKLVTISPSKYKELFCNLHFLLFGGKHLSKNQMSIHSNNIKKRGGRVSIFQPTDNSKIEDIDYIISGNENYNKIKEILSIYCDNFEQIPILTPDWIIDSIKYNKLIIESDKYKISKPRYEHKSSSSQPSSSQIVIPTVPIQTISSSNSQPTSSNDKVDKVTSRNNRFVQHFICVKGSTMEENNLNKEITDLLDQLQKHYEGNSEQFRSMAYRKASTIIKSLKFKITAPEQINNIPNIGQKIRDKIKEFLAFGKIRRLESLQQNEHTIVLQTFTKIKYVGPETAQKLYTLGYRSVEQLKENTPSFFTKQQLIGLKYYEDFLIRIPREQVEEISKVVGDIASEFSKNLTCETCGSYRRGKSDSGDVDILISTKENDNANLYGLLPKIVEKLMELNIITDTLSMSQKLGTEDECDTFMGVYKLHDNIHHRIDIKIYKKEHYPFAVLYFTGSDHFNRSMRLLCRKKGYSLSDKCLYIGTIRDFKSNRIHDGKPVHCKSEREIFDYLGIPYKEPHERDV